MKSLALAVCITAVIICTIALCRVPPETGQGFVQVIIYVGLILANLYTFFKMWKTVNEPD